MRALFDVNFLLALLDQEHIFHARARSWWSAERQHGWASCPLSQNGFVRIISQRSYSRPRSSADAISMLARAVARPDHTFWPDSISVLDGSLIDHSRVLGPRQLTDIYLLALAVHRGGRLVTIDRSISLGAVKGACREHLVVVA
ncbi:MAG: VapC toxin family PIN domain ribonuclease [Hyphomicrobium sp. 32-62-53]|nr:MAG: VapC toxin family PIN domain ribonuclease [Hyphomicrobium sp. 12-62-95]OYX98616.1 MAG: VapC toxin family PIN domain ribonuclease [Hyphomicrobium sp. 32-62-53]